MKLDRDRIVTATTLLDAYDKYVAERPRGCQWGEEEVAEHPVALCRLRQLKAILRAFGIDGGPENFAAGKFLDGRENEYEALVESVRPLMRPTFAKRATPHDVRMVFRTLRTYRQAMRAARHSYGCFLSCSGFVAHAVDDVIGPINEELVRLLEPVDSLLAAIVAPDGRTFTIGELIDTYGYVDADADEMAWESVWGFLNEDLEEGQEEKHDE